MYTRGAGRPPVAHPRACCPGTSSTSCRACRRSRSSAGRSRRRGDPGHRRSLPQHHDGRPAGVVPVLARPRAPRHAVGRAGRRLGRPAPGRGPDRRTRWRCSFCCSRPRPTCRCAWSASTSTPRPRASARPSGCSTILETPVPDRGCRARRPAGRLTIARRRTSRSPTPAGPGRALAGATFVAHPGTVTAVVRTLRRRQEHAARAPCSASSSRPPGGCMVHGRLGRRRSTCARLDLAAWRARVAWLPQRAHLVAADLTEQPVGGAGACACGRPDAADERRLAGAGRRRPRGRRARGCRTASTTRLAADGSGLSVGQLQRLALARALLTDARRRPPRRADRRPRHDHGGRGGRGDRSARRRGRDRHRRRPPTRPSSRSPTRSSGSTSPRMPTAPRVPGDGTAAQTIRRPDGEPGAHALARHVRRSAASWRSPGCSAPSPP